ILGAGRIPALGGTITARRTIVARILVARRIPVARRTIAAGRTFASGGGRWPGRDSRRARKRSWRRTGTQPGLGDARARGARDARPGRCLRDPTWTIGGRSDGVGGRPASRPGARTRPDRSR